MIDVSALQPPNTQSLIETTDLGLAIFTNDVHSENATSPMEITDSVMVTYFSELQLKNAPSPMVVTESGIVIEDNALHSEKA